MFSIKSSNIKKCPTKLINTGVTPHIFITENGTLQKNADISSSHSSTLKCNSNSSQTTLKNDPYIFITNPRWGV